MNRLAANIATLGPLGFVPVVSGTVGSLAALPMGYGLHYLGGPVALALGALAALLAGLWASRVYMAQTGRKDPGEVIIDEVAGQLVALLPLSIGMAYVGAEAHVFPWPGWVSAFVLFRFFDILKIGPVKYYDQRNDPVGVMFDDIVAGVFAALGVCVLAVVWHGFLILG